MKETYSKEFYLGVLVGEYIVTKYLPTLSTDLIKTRNTIQVSEDDTKEHTRLETLWYDKSMEDRNNQFRSKNEHWIPLLEFEYRLREKYLPHELKCLIPKFGLHLYDDITEIKKGIRSALWDSEICYYKISTIDDIDIDLTNEYRDMAWCEEITLKLDVKTFGKSK